MSFIIDLKYALRLLSKNPAFSALSLIVLTIGLAVSLLTFSFSYTIMHKALPAQYGDGILNLCVKRQFSSDCTLFDALDFSQIRGEIKTLDNLGAYSSGEVLVEANGNSRRLLVAYTDWNMFELTPTKPALGRTFRPDDNVVGAEPVAVISHKVWQTLLAGDQQALNSTINIDGKLTRIVGIMPEDYRLFSDNIWIPWAASSAAEQILNPTVRDVYSHRVYARLKKNASESNANAEINTLMQRIEAQDLTKDKTDPESIIEGAFVTTLQKAVIDEGTAFTFLLYNILSIFLLILACISVANLILSRTTERIKEVAVRVALGASRYRLFLQMMWENIIICVIGGGISTLIVAVGLNIIDSLAASNGLSRAWWVFSMDWVILGAAAVFVFFTILIAGGIPVWKTINGDFNAVLRDGTRGAQGKKAGGLIKTLITSEIIIVSTLMFFGTIAGVVANKLINVDRGMDPENILSATIKLPQERYATANDRRVYFQQLKSRMDANTNVEETVLMANLGLNQIRIDGVEYRTKEDLPSANARIISGSLKNLGISLINGRYLDNRDDEGSLKSVVVSQTMAKRFWPESSALGKRVNVELAGSSEWYTVVGIVSDIIEGSPLEVNPDRRTFYISSNQQPISTMQVLTRYYGDEQTIRDSLTGTTLSLNPDITPDRVEPFEKQYNQVIDLSRFVVKLAFISSFIAMLIAITGIYGLTSNSIIQRTHEIGTRRALGSTDSALIKLLLRQGSKQLVIGLIVSAIITSILFFPIHQLLGGDLMGIYFTSAILVLAIISSVVLLAIYIPSKRAVKQEISESLRYE